MGKLFQGNILHLSLHKSPVITSTHNFRILLRMRVFFARIPEARTTSVYSINCVIYNPDEVFTARYKLYLNIIQVGAESKTTFPANIHPDCTRLGITTHKNLINKSLYVVTDCTVLLMEPKCGTFIFQKLPDFLQNL